MNLLGALGKNALTSAGKGLLNVLKKKNPKLSETEIIDQITKFGNELFSTDRAEGATLDLAKGKFLTPKEDKGFAMASIPNPANKSNVVKNINDLINYAKTPEVMNRLKKGDKLGTWNSEEMGGLVVDPTTVHKTKLGSLLSGKSTDQLSGFNIGKGKVYDVNNKNLNKERAKWLTGITGVAVASNAIAPKDEAEAITPMPILNQLTKLGVKTGIEGAKAGAAAISRAKSIGVPESELSHIKPNEGEKTAWAKVYETTRQWADKAFNKISPEEIKMEQAKLLKHSSSSPVYTIDSQVKNKIASKYKSTDQVYEGNSAPVSAELEPFGYNPVRHMANPDDIKNVRKKGNAEQEAEATEDMINNLMLAIPDYDLVDIKKRNNMPIFYVLKNLEQRARAAMLDMPVIRKGIASGAASKAAGPVDDEIRSASALFTNASEDNIAKGLSIKADEFPKMSPENEKKYKAWQKTNKELKKEGKEKLPLPEDLINVVDLHKAKIKERSKGINSGKLINTAVPNTTKGRINTVNVTLDAIHNDIITFLKDPTKVKGIKEKIATYLGTNINPELAKHAAVMDSWMMRAAFGNLNLSTAGSSEGYAFVHNALKILADRLDVSPGALQEVIWKNIRFMSGQKSDESFAALNAGHVIHPNVTRKVAEKLPDTAPTSVTQLSKHQSFIQKNTDWNKNILDAIKEDPSLAEFFQIVGQDIELSPKFFEFLDEFGN